MKQLSDITNRREFVQKAAVVSVGGFATLVFACSKSSAQDGVLQCYVPEKLTDKERKAFDNVSYIEKTLSPTKRCDNCNLWIAAKDATPCGGCKILKGAIHPAGYCTAWAPGASKKS